VLKTCQGAEKTADDLHVTAQILLEKAQDLDLLLTFQELLKRQSSPRTRLRPTITPRAAGEKEWPLHTFFFCSWLVACASRLASLDISTASLTTVTFFGYTYLGRWKRHGVIVVLFSTDHDPKHVHVFEDRKRLLKVNIETWTVMEGKMTPKAKKALETLRKEGIL